MLALRLSAALLAFALVSLTGCAHRNLAVRASDHAGDQMTRPAVHDFSSAELVRDLKVPYRPSDFLPIARQRDETAPEQDFDLDEHFGELFAAAFPTG